MNNLKYYRIKTGLSQAKFANHFNWSQSRIGNYEAGIRKPDYKSARVIVHKLNELGVKCGLLDVFPIYC